jgi:hypothetical protein
MSTTITWPFLATLLFLAFVAGGFFPKKQPVFQRPDLKRFFKTKKIEEDVQRIEPRATEENTHEEVFVEHKISSFADLFKESDAISSDWFPLPDGETLELGNSGFYIKMQTAMMAMPTYIGYSPEHRTICGANSLHPVKTALQTFARERAEFAPPNKLGAFELKK